MRAKRAGQLLISTSFIAPDAGPEVVAANNWDGAAVERFSKWKKRVTHYIIVNIDDDGVILPTPGDHGRDLYFYPEDPFNLEEMAASYEVCEFEGDELICDLSVEAMNDFLSAFEIAE